jgi:hypothetical protein
MPSFRDLKGRELEEVVDSRVGPTTGGYEDPGEALAEREHVRAAMEKAGVGNNRPRRREREPTFLGETFPEGQDDTTKVLKPTVPLPHDFEQGLLALEQTLRSISEALALAAEQMQALRERAEQDADRLAKVDAALRVLQG